MADMAVFLMDKLQQEKYKQPLLHFSDDDSDTDSVEPFELAGFSQYLYFLFIPTLIYRDSYPMWVYYDLYYTIKWPNCTVNFRYNELISFCFKQKFFYSGISPLWSGAKKSVLLYRDFLVRVWHEINPSFESWVSVR